MNYDNMEALQDTSSGQIQMTVFYNYSVHHSSGIESQGRRSLLVDENIIINIKNNITLHETKENTQFTLLKIRDHRFSLLIGFQRLLL
jgi:hypothetical protein